MREYSAEAFHCLERNSSPDSSRPRIVTGARFITKSLVTGSIDSDTPRSDFDSYTEPLIEPIAPRQVKPTSLLSTMMACRSRMPSTDWPGWLMLRNGMPMLGRLKPLLYDANTDQFCGSRHTRPMLGRSAW